MHPLFVGHGTTVSRRAPPPSWMPLEAWQALGERMIDRVYSHLVDGSDEAFRDRLNAHAREAAERLGVERASESGDD